MRDVTIAKRKNDKAQLDLISKENHVFHLKKRLDSIFNQTIDTTNLKTFYKTLLLSK